MLDSSKFWSSSKTTTMRRFIMGKCCLIWLKRSSAVSSGIIKITLIISKKGFKVQSHHPHRQPETLRLCSKCFLLCLWKTLLLPAPTWVQAQTIVHQKLTTMVVTEVDKTRDQKEPGEHVPTLTLMLSVLMFKSKLNHRRYFLPIFSLSIHFKLFHSRVNNKLLRHKHPSQLKNLLQATLLVKRRSSSVKQVEDRVGLDKRLKLFRSKSLALCKMITLIPMKKHTVYVDRYGSQIIILGMNLNIIKFSF